MKTRWTVAPLALTLALALCSGALAGEVVTVDKIDLGTHVYGDSLSPQELAGHVVLVFFWDMG